MSGRGALSRRVLQANINSDCQKDMSPTSDHAGTLARSLSESSGTWRGPTRSRSATEQDLASIRDEARSRAKVSGILGLEDNTNQRKPRQSSTSRARGLPLRTQSRCNRSMSPPMRDGMSPLLTKGPFHRSATHGSSAWFDTWVWFGGGRTPQRYRGFAEDRDMYMSNGDTAVYFTEEAGSDDARPMLRVHSSVLRHAQSTLLNNLLHYGALYSDAMLTPPQSEAHSPGCTSPSKRDFEYFNDDDDDSNDEYSTLDSQRSFLLPSPGMPDAVPKLPKQLTGERNMRRVSKSRTYSSRSASATDLTSTSGLPDHADIAHELWLSSPSSITDVSIQRRHHMGTRNFFALLYGHPIVGSDFYEMLVDLHAVMEEFYEHNTDPRRRNVPQAIISYLKERKLDDLRGNIRAALGLLAWCEEDSVRWEEGYLEAFVHCVGMMSQSIMNTEQFQRLSRVTRHNLENAFNDLQLRVLHAEEKLASFKFPDIWAAARSQDHSPAHRSYSAFREFLTTFYGHVFCNWPPTSACGGRWLTRDVVRRLQQDFGAAYDYMVDMDVLWDASEERHTRKWEMMKRVPSAEAFNADKNGIPVTDMLVGFDSRHGYMHIPFPFPLTPRSNLTINERQSKKGVFSTLRRTKTSTAIKDPKEQMQMALAYNAATNISRFGTSFPANELIDRLERYEKSYAISGATPYDARIGRWVLIYGVLQILSTLAVDNPGLRYAETCQYFLCSSLAGCPPWRDAENSPNETITEASQAQSYCWKAPQRWDKTRRRAHPNPQSPTPSTVPSMAAPTFSSAPKPSTSYELLGSLATRGPGSNSAVPQLQLRGLTSPTGFIAELDSIQIAPQLPPYSAQGDVPPPVPEKNRADVMKPMPDVPTASPRRLPGDGSGTPQRENSGRAETPSRDGVGIPRGFSQDSYC